MSNLLHSLIEGVNDSRRIAGLTHTFYRYPARFSPRFARAAIQAFSSPGDVIIDPFMGGGTTLVEASATGRLCLGVDASSLAAFISKAKTTPLLKSDVEFIEGWISRLPCRLKMNIPSIRPVDWISLGYQRNINSRKTWRIRKMIELYMEAMDELSNDRQSMIARCAVLKTAQWALDSRRKIPNTSCFRDMLLHNLEEMSRAALGYGRMVTEAFATQGHDRPIFPICLHRSAIGMERDRHVKKIGCPALILTSPPYPGIHILYHRWQVEGRRETPAPFWIANRIDGNGASHYTFGDRQTHCGGKYFSELERAFTSIARIAGNETILVQMVGFSDAEIQLDQYLSTLDRAGWKEVSLDCGLTSLAKRFWRKIPNRKWYIQAQRSDQRPREVVLIHVKS